MIPCVFFQSNRKAGIRLESNSIKSSEVRWVLSLSWEMKARNEPRTSHTR
jgi:hypothetical protein